jgi:hypothetical protein
MAILHQIRAWVGTLEPTVKWWIRGFDPNQPKSATFKKDLFMTQVLNLPLGEGEDGLGHHLVPPPPPHSREFFFFASFSLVT